MLLKLTPRIVPLDLAARPQAVCARLRGRGDAEARRALEYAATFGLTVIFNSQDHDLAEGGLAHEGPTGAQLVAYVVAASGAVPR